MAKTIKMFCGKKTGDIHPDEVEHMRLHGWQTKGEPEKESNTPNRCQFIRKSDQEQCKHDAIKGSEYCHIPSHKG